MCSNRDKVDTTRYDSSFGKGRIIPNGQRISFQSHDGKFICFVGFEVKSAYVGAHWHICVHLALFDLCQILFGSSQKIILDSFLLTFIYYYAVNRNMLSTS